VLVVNPHFVQSPICPNLLVVNRIYPHFVPNLLVVNRIYPNFVPIATLLVVNPNLLQFATICYIAGRQSPICYIAGRQSASHFTPIVERQSASHFTLIVERQSALLLPHFEVNYKHPYKHPNFAHVSAHFVRLTTTRLPQISN